MARGARTVREDNSRRGRGGEVPARPSVPLPAARRRGGGGGRDRRWPHGRAGARARALPAAVTQRPRRGRAPRVRARGRAGAARTHARGGPALVSAPFLPARAARGATPPPPPRGRGGSVGALCAGAACDDVMARGGGSAGWLRAPAVGRAEPGAGVGSAPRLLRAVRGQTREGRFSPQSAARCCLVPAALPAATVPVPKLRSFVWERVE